MRRAKRWDEPNGGTGQTVGRVKRWDGPKGGTGLPARPTGQDARLGGLSVVQAAVSPARQQARDRDLAAGALPGEYSC